MGSPFDRVVINGVAGAGKTTLARELSRRWAIPWIDSDALFWEEDWQGASLDVFRARVEEATRGGAWVFDGNYGSARDIVWPRAQLLIWLDFPLHLTLRRVVLRSVRRSVTREPLGHGNVETWARTLSRDSVALHSLKAHAAQRRRVPEWIRGCPHLEVLRARSPRQLQAWLQAASTSTST